MSRKDFELIAAALHDARLLSGGVMERSGVHLATEMVANALQINFPRFDLRRFMEAAEGVDN